MNYTIKAGDTLAKIASRNGVTLVELLQANPKLKANPNSIRVGDVLVIPDTLTTADTQPLPMVTNTASAAAATAPGALGMAVAAKLGTLSAKFETGGRGPGTVSSGAGDPGGVSYGSYQMATKTGTVKRFVSQPDLPWRSRFADLTPGTAAFTEQWKQIAANETTAFQVAQHEFIKRTHFDLLVVKIKAEDGLDVTSRSHTLQDVVWSTSVQHGGATPIIHRALARLNLTATAPDFDKRLISAIYAERGRKGDDGKLVYFSKSRLDVQAGVANRFKNEESDALKMLANEV